MKNFIKLLAKRARFSEKDVKIIFDEIVKIFEEHAEKGETLKINKLGKMYSQILPPRKGKDGTIYPEAFRTVFRLSENIRYAHKNSENVTQREMSESDEDLDLTD